MWSPPDPISGFSHDVLPPRTDPGPGTATIAARQRQEAERRLASGETMTAEDRHAEGVRRMLEHFGRRTS